MRLLMLTAAIIALCGCYKYHDEIVDATRDAEMSAWLDKHNLRISHCAEGCGCTGIFVEKKEGGAK